MASPLEYILQLTSRLSIPSVCSNSVDNRVRTRGTIASVFLQWKRAKGGVSTADQVRQDSLVPRLPRPVAALEEALESAAGLWHKFPRQEPHAQAGLQISSCVMAGRWRESKCEESSFRSRRTPGVRKVHTRGKKSVLSSTVPSMHSYFCISERE